MRLVVDWDGTVTVRDSLVQVIHEFGDPALLAELEPRVGIDLTLHEEIALEFRAITAPLEEVARWVVRHVEVRPGLRELAALEPVVISAGFHELIEPVLARERLELNVLANRLDARPDGWIVLFRDEAACATCGEPCKRGEPRGRAVRLRRRRLLGPLRRPRGGPDLRPRLARDTPRPPRRRRTSASTTCTTSPAR